MAGLGANQPEDAIYPILVTDADGKTLTGEGKYVLHFSKEQLPPVGAGTAPPPMVNEPPEPHELVGTLVHVADGVTEAHGGIWLHI